MGLIRTMYQVVIEERRGEAREREREGEDGER
jgi:hypothetical protein